LLRRGTGAGCLEADEEREGVPLWVGRECAT
jgi:hypothetical protein